jgi:hypothetical protein
LLGAYLSEGNIRHEGGIEINQRKESKGFVLYSSLIQRITKNVQHNGKAFIIPRRGITEHFKQFGKAHEKFIPSEIMDATPHQLKIFEALSNIELYGDIQKEAKKITKDHLMESKDFKGKDGGKYYDELEDLEDRVKEKLTERGVFWQQDFGGYLWFSYQSMKT